MNDKHRIKFGLVCLMMAALTGLIGFLIVYHYATFERPLQRFAIVIDAGSTQTRSSLYTLELNTPHLLDSIESLQDRSEDELQVHPLAEFVQIKQVSTCVNGKPLARLQSPQEARQLVHRCLLKFAQLITRLDFKESPEEFREKIQEVDQQLEALDSDEVGLRLAQLDRRINSITRLYVGATAGMRALAQLDPSSAQQKIHWVSEALLESNRWIDDKLNKQDPAPHLNRAFVDIISGQEEAAYGWISVNFVLDRLTLELASEPLVEPDFQHMNGTYYGNRDLQRSGSDLHRAPLETVGTLELGGASAQMAFQIVDFKSTDETLEVKPLQLFNSQHLLATRSDLCLGMSQAILRTSYMLLRERYSNHSLKSDPKLPPEPVELENPCMQNKARTSMTSDELDDILNSPCLRPAQSDPEQHHFRQYLATRPMVRFVGSGQVSLCSELLDQLVDPHLCRHHFSICPQSNNSKPPPTGQPFVTVSGYNKALKMLHLDKAPVEKGAGKSELERVIADRLGGYAIDRDQLGRNTRGFCQTDVSELPIKYPDLNKAFYSVNCLQVVYIDKLLTKFYLFDTPQAWSQIKFLLFPAIEEPDRLLAGSRSSDKNDIGWTLGLLLNATSQQVSSELGQSDSCQDGGSEIFYHHGATIGFVVRATLCLMLACCLLAICLLLFGAIIIRNRRGYKWRTDNTNFC